MSIHQVSGRDGQIIGSCEFRIPVSKAELILDEEIGTLSVFRHIAMIPTDNRWHPLMQRYVHHLHSITSFWLIAVTRAYPTPFFRSQMAKG